MVAPFIAAAAPALISGAVSLIGGLFGKKSADKANKQQANIQQQQIDSAKARLDDYNKRYGTLEQMLIDRANQGATPDIAGVTARANADINQQFANSEATRLRNLARIGVNPSSGRADAMAMDVSLARAKALAGGLTSARENERRSADNQSLDMLSKVTQIGVNKLNNAQSSLDNSMNNMANIYGNRATNSANMAGAMIGNAVDIGGRLLGDYLQQRANPMEYAYQHQKIPEPVFNPNWNKSAPAPVIMDKIDNNPLLANSA